MSRLLGYLPSICIYQSPESAAIYHLFAALYFILFFIIYLFIFFFFLTCLLHCTIEISHHGYGCCTAHSINLLHTFLSYLIIPVYIGGYSPDLPPNVTRT